MSGIEPANLPPAPPQKQSRDLTFNREAIRPQFFNHGVIVSSGVQLTHSTEVLTTDAHRFTRI